MSLLRNLFSKVNSEKLPCQCCGQYAQRGDMWYLNGEGYVHTGCYTKLTNVRRIEDNNRAANEWLDSVWLEQQKQRLNR